MCSCLDGQEVAVQEVPNSIPGSGKDFYVCCLFVIVVVFTVLSKNSICYEIRQFLWQCLSIEYTYHTTKCVTDYKNIKIHTYQIQETIYIPDIYSWFWRMHHQCKWF